MTRPLEAVLLHAYSRGNAGDGLLVDLSAALLREALGQQMRLVVVAADPQSFGDYPDLLAAPVLGESGLARYRAAVGLPGRSGNRCDRQLKDAIERADLLVGVGGGYLRASNAVQLLKLQSGHMRQVRLAVHSGKPTVYLPQSIGPVRGLAQCEKNAVGTQLRAALGSFERVFVRDDRSAAWLARNDNVARVPDLAVLEYGRLARRGLARAEPRQGSVRRVAVVLREAPAWKPGRRARYDAFIRRLITVLGQQCELGFALQSVGRGNDDMAYYRRLGVRGEVRSLKEALVHDAPDVVVSVRLHGALESILCGVPAFHLSCERKGFGAYDDLGVGDWVANAADCDVDTVVGRILSTDAVTSFWTATAHALGALRIHRENVVETLRAAAHGARRGT